MNSQEAITLLRNLEDALDSYCELNEEGKTAFRMAITALEQSGCNYSESPNGWIPCSERLPEEYSEVLCCDTHGEFIIGMPYAEEESNNGFSAEGDNDYLVDCVAWQPLPEPYKGEGDKDGR